jgi:hypothetical protein
MGSLIVGGQKGELFKSQNSVQSANSTAMLLQHCQQTGSYITPYTTVNYNELIQDNFILLEKREKK